MKKPSADKPAATPKSKAEILVLRYLTAQARGSAQYKARAAALEELKVLAPPGETITLADGRRFVIADVFAESAGKPLRKMVYFDPHELRELKA